LFSAFAIALRREFQHRQRLLRGQTADEVHHAASLHRRDVQVACDCTRTWHHCRVALRWHLDSFSWKTWAVSFVGRMLA